MKIIKFKDGQYAIRRWVFVLGYQYLDLKEDYWWGVPRHAEKYSRGTKGEVENRLKKYGIERVFSIKEFLKLHEK